MGVKAEGQGDGGRDRPSMREVADLAGVAISSVSRVLSEHPDVSPKMRNRVLDAVRELEYEPDFLAQSLRRGSTRSVGFVVGDISNPLMADFACGAESVLRAADYSMLLMNSESHSSLDIAHIRFFATRRVDGMILSLASERNPRTLELLRSIGLPVVLVDRDLPEEIGASAVLSGHAVGMTDAIDHLLDLGHRRIALVTGAPDIRPGHARLAAMRAAIASRGLRDDSLEAPGTFDAAHGEAATRALLDGKNPPTAIIAGGNQLLVGCLRAIAAAGLRVGSDVSVVSCDDTPLVEFHQPPIACITRDAREVGRTAAELLLKRLEGAGGPEIVTLPTTFVPSDSIAAPRKA